MLLNIIGFLGSFTSFVLWLPQARIVWKIRNDRVALGAVSLATQFIVVVNSILWLLYAIIADSFWVGAPGMLSAPLAIMTIVIITKARRAPASASPVQEELDEGALLPA